MTLTLTRSTTSKQKIVATGTDLLPVMPSIYVSTFSYCFSSTSIGQKKAVTIIKMVSQNTVDEDIYQMQQRKAKMNAAIMGNDADWKKSLERDKEVVLKNVVDRFLQSPPAEDALMKENNAELATRRQQRSDSL